MNLGFGENISRYRKLLKLTQGDFAKLFNVTRGSVSNWESEKTEPPFSVIVELAKRCNVSTDEILLDSKSLPNKSVSEYKTQIKLLEDEIGELRSENKELREEKDVLQKKIIKALERAQNL